MHWEEMSFRMRFPVSTDAEPSYIVESKSIPSVPKHEITDITKLADQLQKERLEVPTPVPRVQQVEQKAPLPGAKGEKGEQGVPGIQGPPGASGKSIKTLFHASKHAITPDLSTVLLFPFNGTKYTLNNITLTLSLKNRCMLRLYKPDTKTVLAKVELPESGFLTFEWDEFESVPEVLTSLELQCQTIEMNEHTSEVLSVEVCMEAN